MFSRTSLKMPHSPQLCPHDKLHRDGHGLGDQYPSYTSLSTYRAVRSRCAVCDSILGVIEEVMPGWVGERYETRWITTYLKDKRLLEVALYEGSSSLGSFMLERDYHTLKLILRFQLLRRPICKSSFISIVGVNSLPIYNNKPQFAKPILADPVFTCRDPQWSWASGHTSLLEDYYSLDIIEDTRSELALERISKWLSHCIENHESCKPPDPSYIPHRLIHVGSFGKEEPSLVEPSQPVPYLCLSYCWGPDTKDVLVTTTANLASHYKVIPLATVPATIRDAISICRGLGFAYL